MASSSFRDSMNSLGWSRRSDPDVPVNTQQTTGLLSSIKSLNPFGDSGYVRLPTTEGAGAPLPARNRREEEEAWFACSALFLASWAAMMGPITYAQHLMSTPRLPFTAAYFGSIGLTLYFSLGLQSTILTLISSLAQLACLLWYLVSYFPMGSSGLRLATTFGAQRAAAWMTG
ncbi:Protein transport protein SFT2 [Lachnellula suecica]|uniref:Protein transport protein SFT2 n=1 Tax=Lachnellula suecica TaxID=602035 RepID=A0A8T9CCY6_9HELO|nr:Protein transport protein SFT2 [Lachnellula suecica]